MPINEREYYRDKFYPDRDRVGIEPHGFIARTGADGKPTRWCVRCGLHQFNSAHVLEGA